MTDISELIERVKAATGPDRELDEAIRFYFDPKGSRYYSENSAYTASIDAALALVERVLPEHDWILGHTNGGLTIHCQLGPDADKMAFGDTPALAILLALLTALQSTHSGQMK